MKNIFTIIIVFISLNACTPIHKKYSDKNTISDHNQFLTSKKIIIAPPQVSISVGVKNHQEFNQDIVKEVLPIALKEYFTSRRYNIEILNDAEHLTATKNNLLNEIYADDLILYSYYDVLLLPKKSLWKRSVFVFYPLLFSSSYTSEQYKLKLVFFSPKMNKVVFSKESTASINVLSSVLGYSNDREAEYRKINRLIKNTLRYFTLN